MTANFVRSFVVLAVLILTTACAHNPIGPDPVDNGPKPEPAPGTTVQTIPLPGTDKPLLVWITSLSHPKGSQLQVGQTATVNFTCGGPGGYIAHIGTAMMSGDSITVRNGNPVNVASDYYESAGGDYRVFSKCDMTGQRGVVVRSTTPDVTHISFFVWVAQGQSPNSNRPPDAVFKESLDWGKP